MFFVWYLELLLMLNVLCMVLRTLSFNFLLILFASDTSHLYSKPCRLIHFIHILYIWDTKAVYTLFALCHRNALPYNRFITCSHFTFLLDTENIACIWLDVSLSPHTYTFLIITLKVTSLIHLPLPPLF